MNEQNLSDLQEALSRQRKALITQVVGWFAFFAGLAAVAFGIWFLWRGLAVTVAVTELLWELAIVTVGGTAVAVGIVAVLEGRTKAQQIMMPGADENHALLDWIGRIVGSRSEQRKPLDPVSEHLVKIEKSAQAVAILVGLGQIANGIRAAGKYLLLGLIFLAVVWALSPFAASLVP